ncbi:hypothetical protein C5167_036154 [Papaver somniferum]|nr:hypothetical protein C5167_036154 [Papaver somniferum]
MGAAYLDELHIKNQRITTYSTPSEDSDTHYAFLHA